MKHKDTSFAAGLLPSKVHSDARNTAVNMYQDALNRGSFQGSPVERKIATNLLKQERHLRK